MAEFREDVSFDLKGFSPTRLCALPNHGCLVAVSSSGGLRSLDLVSGTQVHATGTWMNMLRVALSVDTLVAGRILPHPTLLVV